MTYNPENISKLTSILGTSGLEAVKNLENICPDFAKYIVEFGYGDIYKRPILSDKIKEMVCVANMMGQGKSGFAFKTHINSMLNVGWNKEEILELIIFLAIYNGFPTSVESMIAAQEVFNERNTNHS